VHYNIKVGVILYGFPRGQGGPSKSIVILLTTCTYGLRETEQTAAEELTMASPAAARGGGDVSIQMAAAAADPAGGESQRRGSAAAKAEKSLNFFVRVLATVELVGNALVGSKGTDIFLPYLRLDLFREVQICPYASSDIQHPISYPYPNNQITYL